jgi:predicted nucleic acid-binding protein
MRIVVDTSVIIAVITNELHKKHIIEITKNAELIAPPSMHWEIGNAFSAMFRRSRISLEQAKLALSEYKKIPIKSHDVSLDSVLEISKKYNLYAYDVYFLLCAKNLKVPLLSLDKQMIENGEIMGLNTIEVE